MNLYAWASIGENGKVTGGKPGNQSGTELKVGPYYYFYQDTCIRYKSVLKGRKAGRIAKKIALNKNVGYNQAQRTQIYNVAKACDWDATKFFKSLAQTKVNCDCSSFASTVINLTFGREIIFCQTTSTLVDACKQTGKFNIIGINEMLKKTKKGDMPLKAGRHVIINV